MNARDAAPLTVAPYARRYRHAVRDLMFRSYRVHSHLDWHESEEWLETDQYPIQLAFYGDRLVGFIAMSKPLGGTSWVRLAVLSDQADGTTVLGGLWAEITRELRQYGVTKVAILINPDWILSYLRSFQFKPAEEIITLIRPQIAIPDMPLVEGISLRLMRREEVAAITAVDQYAFAPPWQMDVSELRQAEKISALATVALYEHEIVGYSLYTITMEGAHLARLAVLPAFQGRGVASLILVDALQRFMRRSILRMSVNTQGTNVRSQRLYLRYGFARNGYDLPVWMLDL